MSNKKIDALEMEFNEHGVILYQLVLPPVTYVTIKLGNFIASGVMQCMDGDEFDIDYGLKNALRKALKCIYEQRRKYRSVPDTRVPSVLSDDEVLDILIPYSGSFDRAKNFIDSRWVIRYNAADVTATVTCVIKLEDGLTMLEMSIDSYVNMGHENTFLIPATQLQKVGRRVKNVVFS